MPYDPRVLSALRRYAPQSGAPVAYIAAALVESGLDPRAVGDNGDSVGLFQENINGRGHGLSFEERADPVANARRAAEEFARTGGSGPVRAYNAQRPADRADYISKVRARMDEARRLLRGAGLTPNAPDPTTDTVRDEGPASVDDLRQYALNSIVDRQPGQSLTRSIANQFIASKLAPQVAPADDHAGHDHGGKPGKGPGGKSNVPLVGQGGGFRAGGGPEAHGTRALGNWQSDSAYDIMGASGQAVYSPVGGTVVKVSGQPGGDPGFAGYGVTVRTSEGDLFFKHLGTTRFRTGQTIKPGDLIGTLDAATAGGPHLHLGGTNRGQIDRLYRWYLGS